MKKRFETALARCRNDDVVPLGASDEERGDTKRRAEVNRFRDRRSLEPAPVGSVMAYVYVYVCTTRVRVYVLRARAAAQIAVRCGAPCQTARVPAYLSPNA